MPGKQRSPPFPTQLLRVLAHARGVGVGRLHTPGRLLFPCLTGRRLPRGWGGGRSVPWRLPKRRPKASAMHDTRGAHAGQGGCEGLRRETPSSSARSASTGPAGRTPPGAFQRSAGSPRATGAAGEGGERRLLCRDSAWPSPRLSQVCPPGPEGQEGARHTSSRVRSTPGGSLTRPRLVTSSISYG